MRTIQLTHEEIELITTALQFVYDKKLDIVEQNRKVLSEDATKQILDKANKYYDVLEAINEGTKDV